MLEVRSLVKRMYPDGSASLKPLNADHPIFRSWHLLDPKSIELEGVEVGCRTAIVYAPNDLSCLWDKWAPYNLPKRNPRMKTTIARSMRIAMNVIAYATGGELLNKLAQSKLKGVENEEQVISEGYLKIAKIRHTGDWDAAPHAVRHLLRALKKSIGSSVAGAPVRIPASDPNLFRYALVYMHGQRRFGLTEQERKQLRKYLDNWEACCLQMRVAVHRGLIEVFAMK